MLSQLPPACHTHHMVGITGKDFMLTIDEICDLSNFMTIKFISSNINNRIIIISSN